MQTITKSIRVFFRFIVLSSLQLLSIPFYVSLWLCDSQDDPFRIFLLKKNSKSGTKQFQDLLSLLRCTNPTTECCIISS